MIALWSGIFHFQLMWEIFLKFKTRYCRGVQELKTLQLNPQCVFDKKIKNTWTTSPCKTWESWIICITFSAIPLFCFCNDFFWLITHNFWTINISGFGKYYIWVIYILTTTTVINVNAFSPSSCFPSHFTTISADNSLTTLGDWQ